MKLNKNNKELEELKKKVEELPQKDQYFLARLIYKIKKFKSRKIVKVISYIIIICSLSITIKLFGNTDILNNLIKINNEDVVSSVYPKKDDLDYTSQLIYKDFESIEKDFDIKFFNPKNLFTDFNLDIIDVSFDGTKDRIRINALYTNSDNHNMIYSVYVGKSIKSTAMLLRESTVLK